MLDIQEGAEEKAPPIARRGALFLFGNVLEQPLRFHLPPLTAIAAAVLAIYWWGIWHPFLGPELPLFYSVAHGKTLSQMLYEYVNFGSVLWFRPTAFYLPYWIGEHFIDWHNPVGWKFFQVAVLIPACWSVYLLTQLLFQGQRLAGVIAALYLAIHPGCISVVLQHAAFDAPHIIFVVLSVVLFGSAQRLEGAKAWWLNSLAVISFIAALTSKELTIVTPLYLGCVSLAVIYLADRKAGVWPETMRQFLFLLPFAALPPLYYYLRVLRMPAYERTGDYRTLFNPAIVMENAEKFPFWILRLFGGTVDSSGQTAGQVHAFNMSFGLVLLVLVGAYWLPRSIRHRETRWKAILLLLWVAIFMSVPVYSGRYLWHIDLALCGYAVLVGVAVSYWIGRIPAGVPRYAGTALILAAFVAAGIASSQDNVLRGLFSTPFRVGLRLLNKLPAPASEVPENGLIYIEDRLNLSPWSYGGQALFKYAYRKPNLREKAVPAMEKIPLDSRMEWLLESHPFFFRYDDEFNWFDDSNAFRAASIKAIGERAASLIQQGDCPAVVKLLDPLKKQSNPGLDPARFDQYAATCLAKEDRKD